MYLLMSEYYGMSYCFLLKKGRLWKDTTLFLAFFGVSQVLSKVTESSSSHIFSLQYVFIYDLRV